MMNEMGGVRDDLSEIRMAVQELSLEVLKMKRFVMEGEDEDEEYEEYEDEEDEEEEEDGYVTDKSLGGFTVLDDDGDDDDDDNEEEGGGPMSRRSTAVEMGLLEQLEQQLAQVSGGKSRLAMPDSESGSGMKS
uniref:Uncharacterized protein n=1 Tax=Tetraselmis chuii TaxID=63592 RepID=A0A7S1T429_9CHLO